MMITSCLFAEVPLWMNTIGDFEGLGYFLDEAR